MALYEFCSNDVNVQPVTVEGGEDQIEGTPQLRRASLQDAVLFGGPLVKRALESCPLKGDRAHILVDTKVALLMPGWFPAIPGWHTDGVPRGNNHDPASAGEPSLVAQAEHIGIPPAYHTIIVGVPCLTKFIAESAFLDLENDENSNLYSEMTQQIENIQKSTSTLATIQPEPGAWASWDWWNIHTAVESQHRGWRLLIRVTESDTAPVKSGFIRSQNQVYVPLDFGW